MRTVLAVIAAILMLHGTVTVCQAGVKAQKGYTKKNGTRVNPYYKSSPDKSKSNNLGTKNPYKLKVR